MPKLTRRRAHLLKGLAIGACIGAVLCAAFAANLLSTLQLQSGDFFFKVAGADDSSGEAESIVVIAIDDASLERLGHFPSWPRSYYADVIDVLVQAEARTVVFDVLFSEPAAGDERLATSLEEAGNVVLPVVYPMAQNHTAIGESSDPEGFISPVSTLSQHAVALGHANLLPDQDGVVRRLPLTLDDSGSPQPALALAAVAKYLRRPGVIESPVHDGQMAFAGRSIPLDDANCMIINYLSPSSDRGVDGAFRTVSFAEALTGEVDPSVFYDKIVLIGATASALGDYFWTPQGQMMYGVDVHASAVHTLLAADFLAPASAGTTVALIMVLAVLCSLIVLRLRVLWATLATALVGVIYLLSAFALYDGGTMANMVYPPLAIAGAFVGANLFNIASIRADKQLITRTFGRYTSPSLVPQILDAIDRRELELEGQHQDATVLFADVRGFTGIAESMPPQDLVKDLNRYLSVLIESVLQHDGMVNKFGGDSIMALWNAPNRCEEHALLAIQAAMAAQDELGKLADSDPSLTKMNFGIGISTGKIVAGNLGTADRMEYSVVGDPANVAAKLTSVAEAGRVWISSEVYQLVKQHVEARPLEPLEIKGKREPIQAYEVVAVRTVPPAEALSEVPPGDRENAR